MEIKTLYRYGNTIVSPTKPEGVDYAITFRLIADEGMALTQNGKETTPCVDTDTIDGWYEIEHKEEVI